MVIPTQAKEAFWKAVEACLVQFHHFQSPDAKQAIKHFQKKLKDASPPLGGEMVYHEEPFYLACDLAGQQLDLASHRESYDKVLEDVKW